MLIDQTRYKQFWANPERYRMAYELNIVPAVPGYALQRGIVFHTVLDLTALGYTANAIELILRGKEPSSDGRKLNISNVQALHAGLSMAQAYLDNADTYDVIETELEFKFDIEGSEHGGIGRLDQLIREDNGKLWLLEFKTGSPKTRITTKTSEWETDKQADFEILGARSHGHEVEGLRVQYVLETTPPRVVEPIYITRSEAQLQRTKLSIHQTCELIEVHRNVFGINQPWTHRSEFPCNGDASYCEHRTICGTAGSLCAEDLGKEWAKREEHLAILRNQ